MTIFPVLWLVSTTSNCLTIPPSKYWGNAWRLPSRKDKVLSTFHNELILFFLRSDGGGMLQISVWNMGLRLESAKLMLFSSPAYKISSCLHCVLFCCAFFLQDRLVWLVWKWLGQIVGFVVIIVLQPAAALCYLLPSVFLWSHHHHHHRHHNTLNPIYVCKYKVNSCWNASGAAPQGLLTL